LQYLPGINLWDGLNRNFCASVHDAWAGHLGVDPPNCRLDFPTRTLPPHRAMRAVAAKMMPDGRLNLGFGLLAAGHG
jgi:hypothetical protein